ALDYGAGDATAIPFLAVAPDHVGELILAGIVNPVLSLRPLIAAETHINRAFTLKAKTPRGVVQLVRREPEVEENAVHGREAASPADRIDRAEVGLDERDSVSKTGEAGAGSFDRRRIGVDANQGATRRSSGEDCFRVPTAVDGAVDVAATGLYAQ